MKDLPDRCPVEHEDELPKKTVQWAEFKRESPGQALEVAGRLSFEYQGPIKLDMDGAPLNPRGRTGITGRGRLEKWGVNHVADPVITRFHPVTAKLQVVVKLREDTHTWVLPGGFVNPGEDVSKTIRHVIKNQGLLLNDVLKDIFNQITDELFADGKVVYRGYVDLCLV